MKIATRPDESLQEDDKEERNIFAVILEVMAAIVCTVAFVVTCLSICAALLGRDAVGSRDYIEYWASGRLLALHSDPYSPKEMLRVERPAGLPEGVPPIVMPNPPTALILVAPLGFMSARVGELLWSCLLLVSLVASVRMVWMMHGAPANQLHFLGYSFGPALVALAAGQFSLFVLLGFVLFLRLHQSKSYWAGASLWLCGLKPHLFLPFGLVLIVWIFRTRRYKVLLGLVSALTFSATIAFILDRSAWNQYLHMMSIARIDKIPIPCLSNLLRRTVSPNTTWLQYLPVAIACIGALIYFRRHRENWDWMAHGFPLMLVSLLTAPYTWLTDQCILIPALLHGAYTTRSRALLAILALATAAIQLSPLLVPELTHSPFYIWTAPLWLVWYLCAVRGQSQRIRQVNGMPDVSAAATSA